MALFLSDDFKARQAARSSRTGAAAAFLLVAFFLSAVPAWMVWNDAGNALMDARRDADRLSQRETTLTTRESRVSDVRAQLAEIRGLEPVLRSRLPAAGVMAAVERSIPPELCCSRITLRGEGFNAGTVRAAASYLLKLEGFQSRGDRTELSRWTNALLAALPPGSALVSLDHVPAANPGPGTLDTFSISLRVAASGDWSRLGLVRIPMEVSSN